MELNYFLKRAVLLESVGQSRPLNIVTLFSGMGAPEIALDRLGIKYNISLASEYDSTAQSIYKQLHNSRLKALIPNVYDILKKKGNRYVNGPLIHELENNVDLLVAGFPCQAFSSSGKGYGFRTRRVYKLDKPSKSYVVHADEHLTEPDTKPGGVTRIKDSVKHPIKSSAAIKPGDVVAVSPDSDGTLSLETMAIIKKLRPTVAILENVSQFKNADFPEYGDALDTELVTEARALIGKSEFINKPGAFMRELRRQFTDMGYSFYPFILDPTSYVQGAIQRRPRVYMIAIKNKVANRISRLYGSNINKLFGVDALQTAEDETFYDSLSKSLDMIFKSRYSTESGYLTNDPKKFLPNIAKRFSIKDLSAICSKLLADVANMIKHGDSRQLDDIITDAYHNDTEIFKKVQDKYTARVPRIIDLKDEDTSVFVEKLINYIDEHNGFNKAYLDKIFPKYVHFPSFEDEWIDIPDEQKVVIESLNAAPEIDLVALERHIIKFILKQYLVKANKNPGGHKTLPTIMKGFKFSESPDKSASSPLFIFRNKFGEIRWGFIHPALQMRFMGMFSKKDSDSFRAAGDITSKKFNDNVYKTLSSNDNSVNDIMARIGNSMSVDVLEKLFKSLIDAGTFGPISYDEDEEGMTSAEMFGNSPALTQGDNYAPGDNRVPGLLFKKPIKRKKTLS